ncbi:MAG TPA: glycosyltransferase family 2 protein [Planctomycetota bacterium]|jgi:glycosyltransferase involved in cell wall biosynthesis|nr:glycosyltransferase family 2 protein [Planctomycetota bacterium]
MIAGALLASLLGMAWAAIGASLRASRSALPRLAPRKGALPPFPSEPPTLSIVVPARNEEKGIEACVRSLLAQEAAKLDVIVVDDGSTDRTRAIVESLIPGSGGRLRLLQAGEPPPGWIGKNHACAQGAAVAEGEWILFTDADVSFEPGTIRLALARALDRRLDFLSAVPRIEAPWFLGALFLPGLCLGIWTAFPPGRVNDPDDPLALGSGAFLLFRRRVYEAIRGHGEVRGNIVEDVSLASLAKRGGFRTELVDARSHLRTSMYSSFQGAWEGITKSAFAGIDFSMLRAWGGALSLSAAALLPFLGLLGAILLRSETWVLWAVPAAAELAVLFAIARECRLSVFLVPIMPAGLAVWSAGILASAMRTRGEGIEWKGRRYYAGGEGIPKESALGR